MSRRAQWLQVVRSRSEWQIVHGDQFRNIVRELKDPVTQKPAMIGLMGRRLKDKAIQSIFPHNNHTRRVKDSTVNLNLDVGTADTANPLLYVDWEPDSSCSTESLNDTGIPRHTIEWECDHASEIMQSLAAKLLFPFLDILCLFIDDFGPEEAEAAIRQWNEMNIQMTPRLVIIASDTSAGVSQTIQGMSKFSGVSIVMICDAQQLSPSSRFRRLKEVVRSELNTSREAKIARRHQFTACHLQPLVASALAQFASGKEFEFLRAARVWNPVTSAITPHIKEFIRVLHSHRKSCAVVATEVAARIIRDAYPSGSHR